MCILHTTLGRSYLKNGYFPKGRKWPSCYDCNAHTRTRAPLTARGHAVWPLQILCYKTMYSDNKQDKHVDLI